MIKTYGDGLNDAWEVIRTLENKLTPTERIELFGYFLPSDIVGTVTLREVMNRIKNYEEIKVGDEVINDEKCKGVVTWVSPNREYITIIEHNGIASRWKKEGFKKTGQHFPQIGAVLKQIEED